MELIDYVIQCCKEGEIKKSTVHLVVNQEGEEKISKNLSDLVLHNCTTRNIVSENKTWKNYFKIYDDDKQKAIVVHALKDIPFKLTKSKD